MASAHLAYNHSHGYAHASNAGFAAHNIRLLGYPIECLHAFPSGDGRSFFNFQQQGYESAV
jgi:hypothetical protein